jgi:hypothetical protein
MSLRRRLRALAKVATRNRDHQHRRYMLAVASVPVPILRAVYDTYRADLDDPNLDDELAHHWPALADLDRRLTALHWPPDHLPDDDPAWYLVELPAPDAATLAEATRALEAPEADPTDRQAAALRAGTTYLAHLARALTLREAQLDRLPAVDAGLAYLVEALPAARAAS